MRELLAWVMRPTAGLLVAVLLAGCGQWDWPVEESRPREVDVVTVQREPFTLIKDVPGRIEPVRSAEVRARVAGIVLKRTFREGSEVKAGEVLFQIDPAPFEAALARAEGQLAQADAQLRQAEATVRRYEPLTKIGAVSQQEYDAALAALRSAQALKRSAQADVQTARLELGRATVRAPIAGRIGRAEVSEGALVGQDGATLLARIQQLDPVYVDFKLPAEEALRLQRLMREKSPPVLTVHHDGSPTERRVALQFADVTVDRGTGEVTLRGLVDNPERDLLPGLFVRVRIAENLGEQILVPQRAVQRDPTGQASVMVLGPDNAAALRPVQTGVMQAGRWHIKEGLKEGEQLITSSLTAITPGAVVVPRTPRSSTTEQQPQTK